MVISLLKMQPFLAANGPRASCETCRKAKVGEGFGPSFDSLIVELISCADDNRPLC